MTACSGADTEKPSTDAGPTTATSSNGPGVTHDDLYPPWADEGADSDDSLDAPDAGTRGRDAQATPTTRDGASGGTSEPSGGCEAEREPNNNPGRAQPVGFTKVCGEVGGTDSSDYFVLTLAAGDTYRRHVQSDSPLGPIADRQNGNKVIIQIGGTSRPTHYTLTIERQ